MECELPHDGIVTWEIERILMEFQIIIFTSVTSTASTTHTHTRRCMCPQTWNIDIIVSNYCIAWSDQLPSNVERCGHKIFAINHALSLRNFALLTVEMHLRIHSISIRQSKWMTTRYFIAFGCGIRCNYFASHSNRLIKWKADDYQIFRMNHNRSLLWFKRIFAAIVFE